MEVKNVGQMTKAAQIKSSEADEGAEIERILGFFVGKLELLESRLGQFEAKISQLADQRNKTKAKTLELDVWIWIVSVCFCFLLYFGF